MLARHECKHTCLQDVLQALEGSAPSRRNPSPHDWLAERKFALDEGLHRVATCRPTFNVKTLTVGFRLLPQTTRLRSPWVDITADVATTEEREQTEAACSARGGKPPPTPRRAQPSQPPDRAAEAARDATARPGLPAAAAEGAASCSRCRGPWAGFPVLFLAGEHDRRAGTQPNRGPAATWKGGIPRSIPRLAAVTGTGARLSVQKPGRPSLRFGGWFTLDGFSGRFQACGAGRRRR